MQNTGKTFEKAIEEVFKLMYTNYPEATIQRDVFLNGPDGKRQFDVVITLKTPDDELITVIEGKDYKKKISVEKLDEFHSKMKDVKANKGILVSKMGFSTTAISKAKRLGITLYSLNDHTEFKEFDIRIPILIEEISPRRMDIIYNISREEVIKVPNGTMSFDKSGLVINNQNISTVINQTWKDGTLKFNLVNQDQDIQIPTIEAPFLLRYFPHKNLKITSEAEITDVKLKLTIQYKYYVCDIRDIMHSKMLKNIDKENLTFFVDTNSITDSLKNLTPVTREYVREFTGIQYVFKVRNTVDVSFDRMILAEPPVK